MTVDKVDKDELAAVKLAQAAEAFYTKISVSDGSASQKDSIVDNHSSEDVVDASAKSNSAFLCMDQAAQNAPDFWLKEDLPKMGITKFEFTGLESQVKMSKGMLQFLLGDSGLDDSDACVAWLVDAKFGEPKFTWKVLAKQIAAERLLPSGIIRPKYAGTGPESNDLRLAVFYAQVTFILLRGGKIASESVVDNLLNPPKCSFVHQESRDQINNHLQCRHTYL